MMKLGYAQSIITPSFENPVYLAGFGQNRVAESVHDDLFVRSLALSDGVTTLVLCALDLLGLFQQDVQEIINRVQALHHKAQLVVASTHTHHGPDTQGLWGPDQKTSGVDPQYLEELLNIVVQTIADSLSFESNIAAIKTGALRRPGIAKNARDPEIIDDELTVVQLLDQEDHPLLTIMDFPCHPEVLWEYNTHITSDYPASLREMVEAQTEAPCIFFPGALGGMMTPDVEDHSFEESELMGIELAGFGLELLRKSEPQRISDRDFYFTQHQFTVKLKNPLFKIAIRRGLLPELRDRRGQVTTQVNLIQIGDCWFVTVPGELLPKLGLAIKEKLRAAGAKVAGIIGLANDELGYILPKEDFHYPLNPLNPKDHYEETMSISKDIGPKLMEAVEQLLKVG